MFTRPLFQTADIEAQHRLLNEVAELVDSGRVRSTMRENYGRIDAAEPDAGDAVPQDGRRDRQDRAGGVLGEHPDIVTAMCDVQFISLRYTGMKPPEWDAAQLDSGLV